MTFKCERLEIKDWSGPMSEMAHIISFGESRDATLNRFDYALVLFDTKEDMAGYSTIKEMDSETAYMQHGGVFPNYEKSVHVVNGYSKIIGWLREHYKRATTKVDVNNHAMIKLAWALGFEITGTSVFKDKIYLELTNEFRR